MDLEEGSRMTIEACRLHKNGQISHCVGETARAQVRGTRTCRLGSAAAAGRARPRAPRFARSLPRADTGAQLTQPSTGHARTQRWCGHAFPALQSLQEREHRLSGGVAG